MNAPEPTFFYVVDWLPPDFGAVGQYGVNFAKELAQAGRHVCLVGLTSGPLHRSSCRVGSGRLTIVQLSAASYNKTRPFQRILWTFRANVRLLWEVIRRRESYKADLLFTGAPPFFVYFAIVGKYLRRIHLIYRTTDFYPEVIIAEIGGQSAMLRLLLSVTWSLRRRVDQFEVLGVDQIQRLTDGGIPPGRITMKRDISPVIITGREPPVSHPAELTGRKALLYSGNYGVPHEVDTVIGGFIRHYRQGSGGVGLWLNATGRSADRVETRLRDAGVPVARSATVPLDRLPALLIAADAHLVTLRPEFSGIVLPSKIYACIASRRPILFVGPPSSDVHHLCVEAASSTYVHISPGDVTGFAAALDRLAEGLR
jgi:hypothetical protein